MKKFYLLLLAAALALGMTSCGTSDADRFPGGPNGSGGNGGPALIGKKSDPAGAWIGR